MAINSASQFSSKNGINERNNKISNVNGNKIITTIRTIWC